MAEAAVLCYGRMFSTPIVLFLVGVSVAAFFYVRFIRNGYFAGYPFFAAYAFYVGLRMVFAATILDKTHIPAFNWAYWGTNNLSAALRMAMVWEVLRQSFPRRHPMRPMVSGVSLVFLLSLAVAFMAMGPEGDVFSDLERRLSLTSAGWMALVVVLMVYFGAPFPRPVLSLVLGLGISSSLNLINFAAFGLSPAFQTAWGLIRQLGFAISMAIWTWGFWTPASKGEATLDSNSASRGMAFFWRHQWERLRALLGAGGAKG